MTTNNAERLFAKSLIWRGLFGGPDRDRTDDLFHAMEARSQLRHRPTLEKDGADYGAIDILSHVNSGVKRASL